jgi:hypothetical protein
MPEFLYIFGYRTPEQQERFTRFGHDDEDSAAVFIEADSANDALAWGREISEEFIRHLFADPTVSWQHMRYAHWIDAHPEEAYSAEALATILHVRHGQHPALRELNRLA